MKKGQPNSYYQHIGAEVMLPDRKSDKLMGRVSKRVIYDDRSIGEGIYIAMHNESLHEVYYPDGTT